MTAWSQEQARHLFIILMTVRVLIALGMSILVYIFYRTWLASERRLKGTDNMPSGLHVGSVVFLDISDNGRECGRIVVGLLNENAPLYSEYFHRRCTGSGADGESFLGMPCSAMLPGNACIFGDGQEMEHGVPGYNPRYLPTEWLPSGPWRGCLTSVAYGPNKESPNFAIHMGAGDYTPQVFGLVLAGYDVLEQMSFCGVKHGSEPKRQFVIEGCGELCTLDKSKISPLPWRLYESVSEGFDETKYGAKSPWSLLRPPAAA
jgi:peptidylprolyl isomerase